MTNVAEDDADPLAIILHRLLPLLLAAALSVKTFVSRWRLVHSNLLRLQSLLSGSSCCHPLFVCLVRSLVPELSGLLSLSRRCLDPSLPDGKLHLQSDLDIASSTLALRLHDLGLLLLHSSSASSAIIGGLDLKLDALQSLQDLLDSGAAAAAEIVAGEGDTTAAVLRLLDHPVLRDRAAALTASLAAASAASRRAVFDEGGLGPLLRLLDPSLAAPPPPATVPPPPSPPSPPTPPPPGASRPTAASHPRRRLPRRRLRVPLRPRPRRRRAPESRRRRRRPRRHGRGGRRPRARRSRRLRHAGRPEERRIVPPLPRLRRRRPDPIDPNPRIRTTAAPPIAGTVASPGLQQNSPLVAAILRAARRPRPPQRQRHGRGAARRPLPRRRRRQPLPRAVHVRPREDDGIVEAADRAGDGARALARLLSVKSNRRELARDEKSVMRLVQMLDPRNEDVAKRFPVSVVLAMTAGGGSGRGSVWRRPGPARRSRSSLPAAPTATSPPAPEKPCRGFPGTDSGACSP
uniref:DUF7032 domain-containing protein n=1 Tax=Ananas comosus var. bracteatus TaxID=296719 RepID=A0A6V7Q934_ANACO|nr:unnamed protein product [Ananas comosus var. bracteatus]